MKRVTGLEYAIVQDEAHWTVAFQGRHSGRYPSRVSALRSAIEDARRVHDEGHEISVLVQRRDGSFRRLPDRLLNSDFTPPPLQRVADAALGGRYRS